MKITEFEKFFYAAGNSRGSLDGAAVIAEIGKEDCWIVYGVAQGTEDPRRLLLCHDEYNANLAVDLFYNYKACYGELEYIRKRIDLALGGEMASLGYKSNDYRYIEGEVKTDA